jgi:diguanylate cyclase (GGDEF)-like protein
MRNAVFSITNSIGETPDGVGGAVTPEVAARRASQRRYMQDLIGVSYVIDAAMLLIYGYAGTIPLTVGPAFALCGLVSIAVFILISELGINDRFRDHYLVVPQATVNLAIMLAFAYAVPQVGFMFLCTLFVVYGFSSLRSTPRQTVMAWTIATLGVAGLFLLTDTPVAMPAGTYLERFATTLVFVLVLGRCMFLGMFANSLRASLYKNSIELKRAYKRIEELAEVDELTGALNRRSIMQALGEEIARARRSHTSCTVALIDLDWFKRINDRFGHPAGDEVLRTFAIAMFANIRTIDKFGRYGGEEFLLILPEAADSAAQRTMDRLRAIVADLDWSAISPGLAVTMSAGIAMLRPNDTPESILARADAALYRAKDLGRNQVAV